MVAERKALLLALCLGGVFWLVDAWSHYYALPPGAAAVREAFLPLSGYTLFSRILTVVLFGVFGVVTGRVLRQRRLAQAALRDSRYRYERVFHHAPDAMWELDPTGRVLQGNLALENLTGLPVEQIVGRCCHEVMRTPLCDTDDCPLRLLASGGSFAPQELTLTRLDGRRVHCLAAISALRDADGAFTGLVEDFRNLAEQRRTEARFQALVDTTGDGVTIIDPDGTVIYANSAFCRSLEYGPEDIIGRKGSALCDAENRAILLRELQRRLDGCEGDYELHFTARSGRQVPFLVTATALLDDSGVYTGSFAVMKDNTERELAAERMAHLNSVLLAIRNVNQLITRERDPRELLRQACECLIQTRGYHVAYIQGLDEVGGFGDFYFAGRGLSAADLGEGRGRLWELVCATEGEPQAIVVGPEQSRLSESLQAEWEAGRSCMAIRLEYGGRRFGYLATSIPSQLADSDDERSLFEEVAGDIAFALFALETETERNRAQTNLELTQYSVEYASDMVFWTGADGAILYANESACRRLLYTRDEFLSMHVWDLDHTMSAETWSEYWESIGERRTHTFETTHTAGNGVTVPVEITVNFLEYQGKEYHFSFARDISGRKRRQAQIQRLNAQYRLLVESELVETFIVQQGRIVFASGSAHAKMGYEPGELVGMNPLDVVSAQMKDSVRQWELRHRSGEPAPDVFETQLVTRGGALRWVEVWTQEIEDFEGAPALIGHMIDVTEARELRGQLEHSQRLESLGTLAGGVAHEFNNVLQAILLNASLLQVSHDLAEPDADKLKTIVERTEYGARLTDQLLTFSRRTPVQYGPLSVGALLEDARRLLERTMPRQIRLRTEMDPDLWTVEGDAGRLKQVFINLALNARDAMPNGGTLVFQAQNVILRGAALKPLQKLQPGPHVLIKIQDTGSGMDTQTLSRAFEPFYTTKGVGEGTGLGLSIVHGIIDAHGGLIRVRSRLGEGTTFQIHLPAQPELAAGSVESSLVDAPHGSSERILVVDDEPEVVRGATEALARFGYRVTSAFNGAEAVELVDQEPRGFDLVILDLVMPGLSGQETLVILKKINPHLKVLIASGYMPQVEKDTAVSGANGYLDKPFSLDRLLETVRGVLEQPPLV